MAITAMEIVFIFVIVETFGNDHRIKVHRLVTVSSAMRDAVSPMALRRSSDGFAGAFWVITQSPPGCNSLTRLLAGRISYRCRIASSIGALKYGLSCERSVGN